MCRTLRPSQEGTNDSKARSTPRPGVSARVFIWDANCRLDVTLARSGAEDDLAWVVGERLLATHEHDIGTCVRSPGCLETKAAIAEVTTSRRPVSSVLSITSAALADGHPRRVNSCQITVDPMYSRKISVALSSMGSPANATEPLVKIYT